MTKMTCKNGNAGVRIRYTQVNSYNYDGQRISQINNWETTYYYYQGGVLLYTYRGEQAGIAHMKERTKEAKNV
ncbi:MAG: hypothetical protein HFG28_06590 [Eubacterium sp.]|nr:hypothetical protein [Eubacterium sp.]